MPRSIVWMCVLILTMLCVSIVCAQTYPNKPMRIVTSGLGGGADFASRLVAPEIAVALGQPVSVDNRATILVAELVSKAPPDGYTLMLAGSFLWMTPLLQDAPYDPMRDFSTISMMTSSPNILVVHPSLPAKSLKELIALAKARPAQLNYASVGRGGSSHLAAELLNSMAGIKITDIPYKTSGAAITDLLTGEVHLAFDSASLWPHVTSGRLRALAVGSTKPSGLAPGLPTLAQTLPGYESISMLGMFAPAKTPEPIIRRLNQEIVRVLGRPDVQEKFFKAGVETVGSSPEELAAKLKSETVRWGKVIKDIGIR